VAIKVVFPDKTTMSIEADKAELLATTLVLKRGEDTVAEFDRAKIAGWVEGEADSDSPRMRPFR
jgi:hypothetical protein